MSPYTVPHILRPYKQSGCYDKVILSLVQCMDALCTILMVFLVWPDWGANPRPTAWGTPCSHPNIVHWIETWNIFNINCYSKIIQIYLFYPSSYPQAPNLYRGRDWSCHDNLVLAHWMKPRYKQSAILLPAFGRSIQVLYNANS